MRGRDGTWHRSRARQDTGQCWKHPRTIRALELSPQHIEAIKPLYVVLRILIPYKVTSKNSQNLVQTNNKCEMLSPIAAELKQRVPRGSGPTELGFFQPLPAPLDASPEPPSPDPFRRLLPGRRGGIRFQPNVKDVPVPNPAPLAPARGAETLPVHRRRGERQQARGSKFLSLGSNKNLGSCRPSCRKPDIQEINTLPTLKGCSGLRGRDASGSRPPPDPHLPRTAPVGAPLGAAPWPRAPLGQSCAGDGAATSSRSPGSFSQPRGSRRVRVPAAPSLEASSGPAHPKSQQERRDSRGMATRCSAVTRGFAGPRAGLAIASSATQGEQTALMCLQALPSRSWPRTQRFPCASAAGGAARCSAGRAAPGQILCGT